MKALERSFYDRPTIEVAKDLLGKYLVHDIQGNKRIGKIIEVEAYLGREDLASHSSKGVTQRTKTMFGPPGFIYVYMIYGMYFCTNVVTEKKGIGSAVLIRALEPVQNLVGKTSGPGLLSKAMGIDKSLNQCDLTKNQCFITPPENQTRFQIEERPRVGVAYAKEWADKLLRFYMKNNPFVSKK